MLTTRSARATLPPKSVGRNAGPITVERATPPASRAEANLAERIRGIFMGHLRHQNPLLPRRVPARAAASGRAMTELGSRPEWGLTELWHFRGVCRRRAQGCHVRQLRMRRRHGLGRRGLARFAAMAPSSYRIVDEPAPSALGRLAMNP